jgi:uncharacterized heparinase superfamily protein
MRRRLRLELEALVAIAQRPWRTVRDLSLRLALQWVEPKTSGLAATPRNLRPVDPEQGRAIAAGDFALSGGRIQIGPNGNPWAMASPNRQFAVALHEFGWLDSVMASGPEGRARGLQLVLGWQREFGRWNRFSWDRAILERRVYAMACHLGGLGQLASEREIANLCRVLLRQAYYLFADPGSRPAERATITAIAACALKGRDSERLLRLSLARLARDLPTTVLGDGGHNSRSPEAAMALLLDLMSLDDGLTQQGRAAPVPMTMAISRLTQAMRFFTLPDGQLASLQGGETCDRALIAAARAHDDQDLDPKQPQQARQSGYQRLQAGALAVMVDVGTVAEGVLASTACAQPLAIEIVCGRDRLVTNGGWSPRLAQADGYRLTPAGSTACLGQSSAGHVLQGRLSKSLGPRLVGGASQVQYRRHEAEAGLLLEASHDGWVAEFGLMHDRRLFIRHDGDELRGEDHFFRPKGLRRRLELGRAIRLDVCFHLDPRVRASLAQDRRSVLFAMPLSGGWRLRTDAAVVSIEQGLQFVNGLPRRTSKVVLRDSVDRQSGGKIRWKLDRAEAGGAT